MKATVIDDIIMRIHPRGETEIGQIPHGVGLERLRFDGARVIDLATLSRIWVEHREHTFSLHCVDTGNCQPVTMLYVQRKNLTIDNGIIRLKTAQELSEEEKQERNQLRKNRLRKRLSKRLGDSEDKLADLGKLVLALLIFKKTGNAQLGQILDTIAEIAMDAYTRDQMEDGMRRYVQTLKDEMSGYYDELE